MKCVILSLTNTARTRRPTTRQYSHRRSSRDPREGRPSFGLPPLQGGLGNGEKVLHFFVNAQFQHGTLNRGSVNIPLSTRFSG